MNLNNEKLASESASVAATVTQKEALAIYYAGHVYHRCDSRTNSDGSTRWHCQMLRQKDLGCPVKLKLRADKTVKSVTNEHNHLTPEKSKVVFNEVKCEAKKSCRKETDASAKTILTEEINAAFLERKIEMNSSTAINIPVFLISLSYIYV